MKRTALLGLAAIACACAKEPSAPVSPTPETPAPETPVPVADDGTTNGVFIASRTGTLPSEVGDCLAKTIASATFPAGAPSTLNIPITFASSR